MSYKLYYGFHHVVDLEDVEADFPSMMAGYNFLDADWSYLSIADKLMMNLSLGLVEEAFLSQADWDMLGSLVAGDSNWFIKTTDGQRRSILHPTIKEDYIAWRWND
jgi:hypothetical protein